MSFDSNWSSVIFLCHCNGTNDSQTFIDETGKVILVTGNAKISTTQSKFDGASAYFDGSGGYLNLAGYSDFNFGTNNLTIEGWIYPQGSGSPLVTSQVTTNLFNFYLDTSTSARLILNNTNVITGITVQANTWQHVAIVRNGLTWKVFVNGTQAGGTYTMGANNSYNLSENISIGGQSPGYYFTGYVDDIRITNNVARYTSNFTPETEPFYSVATRMKDVIFLCHCNGTNDSQTFIDETGKAILVTGNAKISTTQSKFDGSSAYFDGSGDYLSLEYSIDWNLSNRYFTIDCWFYATNTISSIQHLIGCWNTSGSSLFQLFLDSNNVLGFKWSTTGSDENNTLQSSNNSFNLNTWNHVAVVRKYNNLQIYINGISVASTSISGSIFSTVQPLTIRIKSNKSRIFRLS